MLNRNRSLSYVSGQPGKSTWNNSTTTKSPALSNSICQDVIGNPRGQNPLTITHKRLVPGYVDGAFKRAGISGTFEQWPSTSSQIGDFPAHDTSIERFRSVTAALAGSHPGEPVVALPVFLFELKDVPSMLKQAKERTAGLIKNARSSNKRDILRYLSGPKARASDYLAYQFGWRPLVSDLMDMVGVTKWMHDRGRMLRNYSSKGISRRRLLGTFTAQTTDPRYPYDAQWFDKWGTAVTSHSASRWVVSHWSANRYAFETALDSKNVNAFRRAALGLDVSLTHAWDALPWSWLTDWFVDVGSVIHASQNRMGIQFKDAVVMTHRKSTRVISPYPSWLTMTPVMLERETKHRTLTSPLTSIFSGINYLGPKQLGILAALKVTRVKGIS